MTYKEFLKNYLSTVSDDEKMKIVAWLLVFPNTTNMSIDELLSEEMKEHGVKEPCDGCHCRNLIRRSYETNGNDPRLGDAKGVL